MIRPTCPDVLLLLSIQVPQVLWHLLTLRKRWNPVNPQRHLFILRLDHLCFLTFAMLRLPYLPLFIGMFCGLLFSRASEEEDSSSKAKASDLEFSSWSHMAKTRQDYYESTKGLSTRTFSQATAGSTLPTTSQPPSSTSTGYFNDYELSLQRTCAKYPGNTSERTCFSFTVDLHTSRGLS